MPVFPSSQRAILCLCQVAIGLSYLLKCLEWHQYMVWISMGPGQVAQWYSACPIFAGPWVQSLTPPPDKYITGDHGCSCKAKENLTVSNIPDGQALAAGQRERDQALESRAAGALVVGEAPSSAMPLFSQGQPTASSWTCSSLAVYT